MSLTRAVCAAPASFSVWMTPGPSPTPGSGESRSGGISCPSWVARPSIRAVGWLPSVARHPRTTSMSLTNPWYAATSVGPTATGSRARVPRAMCQPRQTHWPLAGLGAGPGVGEWVHPAGPRPWGAWSMRPPSPSSFPAGLGDSHLKVVAAFGHYHGDGTGGASSGGLARAPALPFVRSAPSSPGNFALSPWPSWFPSMQDPRAVGLLRPRRSVAARLASGLRGWVHVGATSAEQ